LKKGLPSGVSLFSFPFPIFTADPEPNPFVAVPFLRILFCLFLAIALVAPAIAQPTVLPLEKVPSLAPAVQLLAGSPQSLKGQVKATESVLDLVHPRNLDSLLRAQKQRHNGLLGLTMHHAFARFWEFSDVVKRKYIGTNSRPLIIWDGIKKEMDINIFLMPSLPAYVSMARAAFEKALLRGRDEDHYRFDRPPFTPDEALRYQDRGYLTIECEITPPEASRAAFGELFFPMTPGEHDLNDMPQFGTASPSVGLYGAWCLDCNHNCRPEIHPIEWMWWLDMSPDDPAHPDDWQWMIGLARDGTGRFEDWSAAPLQGRIAIPIVLPAGVSRYAVRVEALLQDGLRRLSVPVDAASLLLNSQSQQFRIGEDGSQLDLQLVGIPGSELVRCTLGPFQEDGQTGVRLGYLYISADVDGVLALRMTAGTR
jgi:hypothetical protein